MSSRYSEIASSTRIVRTARWRWSTSSAARTGRRAATASPARGGPRTLPRSRVVDARPDDVGREQVGRELEPPERAVDAGRQGAGQERLADPGDVLDQDMPLRQERNHSELDDFGLAQDHRSDVIEEAV